MGFIDGLCSATLKTLHGLLWLRGSLYCLYIWLWSSVLYTVKHKGSKLACIQRDTKSLEKIPLSLAMIIQEEEICYGDLANAVIWGAASGVSNITLYDPYGTLKQDVAKLRTAVLEQSSRIFTSSACQIEVYTSSQLPCNNSTGCLCSVLVLSPEDAHTQVVAATVHICHSVLQRRLRVEQIEPSLVDRQIAGSCVLLDPDLTVIFGSSSSLLGYPPWQTRLTEILTLPSHHKLQYQDFHTLLQRYAKCQQRLGK